jgi:hypothetical protein
LIHRTKAAYCTKRKQTKDKNQESLPGKKTARIDYN